MAVYIIGYDLHPSKGETYDDLMEALGKLSPKTWHCLDSTWMVVTNKTATQIRDELKPHLYKDDQLLVVKYEEHGNGRWAFYGFTGDCAQWIKDNLG
ncbi:hypothetical protein [Labrys sp. ZIDIC5]|uniref:hypothetical protein n=1 Tax=Labrys sedimenti TaxID=3106036 RepID=UPI002ACA412B|nr:hypothetical protein [Labrys sp. ZIDIC5]MDZ5448638.1 hypothetical protein [Labrys sp. ZIDIC5]